MKRELFLAAWQGNLEEVKYQIESYWFTNLTPARQNDALNSIDSEIGSPSFGHFLLHAAIRSKNPDLVAYLVEKECAPNAVTLSLAALSGSVEIFCLLILARVLEAHQRWINVPPATQIEIFGLAKRAPLGSDIRNLCGYLNPQQPEPISASVDNIQNTALHRAASKGNICEFFCLLDLCGLQTDLDQPNAMGESVLHILARSAYDERSGEIIDRLCDDRPQPNLRNRGGENPLHIAMRSRFYGAAKVNSLCNLIGLQPNNLDAQTLTPLHRGIQADSLEKVRALLAANMAIPLTPNSISLTQGTPLYLAVKLGSLPAVETLCSDLRVNVNEGPGKPVHLAIQRNRADIVGHLLDHGATFSRDNPADRAYLDRAGVNNPAPNREMLAEFERYFRRQDQDVIGKGKGKGKGHA